MLGVGLDGPTHGGLADGSPPDLPPLQGGPWSARPAQPDAERDAGLDAERDAWVVMASVDGLGPVAFGALLRRFGNGRSVLEIARRPDGRQILSAAPDPYDRLESTVAGRLVTAAHEQDLILGRAAGLGLTVLTLEDARFPLRLLAVELPPHLLFIQGDIGALSSAHALAVVGTRHPTEHGRRVAAARYPGSRERYKNVGRRIEQLRTADRLSRRPHAAGNQHRGFAVGIFLAGGALFLPVGPAEIA